MSRAFGFVIRREIARRIKKMRREVLPTFEKACRERPWAVAQGCGKNALLRRVIAAEKKRYGIE